MSDTLKSVGDAIAKALDTRAYGLYDYSMYQGEKPPHVVRDERTDKIVFRSAMPEPAEEKWAELNRAFVARAAIEALMPPSAEMLDAALEMSGARVTPYTAHRESGVATESDISPEDAAWMNDEINKEHDNLFRAMLAAALNIQQRTGEK